MTTDLAIPASLPGVLGDDGYALPSGLSFDRWCEILETLQQIDRSVKWALGDALLYGEAAYGEAASQAYPDAFSGSPYAEATLRAAAWVAEAFPRGTRVDGVTWTHHRVVADLPPLEARALLEEAARINNDPDDDRYISSRDLIEQAKAVRSRLRGRAVDAAGAAIEEPEPLTWTPQVSDLSDEARAALAHRLAGIGKRHAIGYERAWLDALVWAQVEDAFVEWKA